MQRRQTLRAAIDWSYDLLTEPERRLLARMSVFAGGCTRESAEAVCAGDPIDASRSFSLLSTVDRSLVVVERRSRHPLPPVGDDPRVRGRTPGRARRDRCGPPPPRRALRRLRPEAHEKARGPEEPEALRLLGAERENLLAAMASAVDSGDVDVALRLLTARGGMVFWFNLQRLPVDALRLKGVAEHPFYPRALVTAACYAVLSGDARGWEELADAALSAAERLAEPDPVVGYLLQWARARMAQYLGLEAARPPTRSPRRRSPDRRVFFPSLQVSSARQVSPSPAAAARTGPSPWPGRRSPSPVNSALPPSSPRP